MNDLIQIKAVVESYNSNINIAEKIRDRHFSDARKMYCYISRKCTRYSLSKIGEFINRDHTTILHSIKRCEDLMLTDKDFRNKVRHCMLKSTNILNIKTATYKEKIDVFWSNLSNEQQEAIYNKVNQMYANNIGLKREINYVKA